MKKQKDPKQQNETYGVVRGEENFFLVSTPAGRVIFSTGSLKLYLETDLTGRNLNDFLSDELAAKLISRAYQNEEMTFECEIKSIRFRGEMQTTDGNMILFLFPLVDQQALFIHKNSAQFIGREMSSSLGVMFAALEALGRDNTLGPQADPPLSILNQNLHMLLRLSRNMLDCALYANGYLTLNMQEGDLAAVTRTLFARVKKICAELGVEVEVNIPDAPVLCRFDHEKVERILLNLVSNSLRARGENRLRFTLADKEDGVTLTLADKAGGIDSDFLSQVFSKHSLGNPESNASLGGAGFGITLVKAFTEAHGGIFVIASTGGGAVSSVTLPKNQDADILPLNTLMPDYAGGFDRTLLELSTVLTRDFFPLKSRSRQQGGEIRPPVGGG